MITSPNKPSTFKSLSTKASQDVEATRKILPRARDQVLDLGSAVGNLCHQISTNAPLDPYRTPVPPDQTDSETFPACLHDHPFWSSSHNDQDLTAAKEDIYNAIGSVFWSLILLSCICKIDLREAVLKKIELNGKKYPVNLCKGKSGKYTNYSSDTGITELNQSLEDIEIQEIGTDAGGDTDESHLDTTTVQGVVKIIRNFAIERSWPRYHTPRNIVLAMMGEVGELCELFQWLGDDDDNIDDKEQISKGLEWKDKDFDHLKQELADVAIYSMRLADVVGIEDLGYLAARSCGP